MRCLVKNLLVSGFVSAIAATAAFGQIVPVTFDENGNSGGAFGALPFSIVIPDPVNGIATLSYALPFGVVPGDVLVNEIAGSPTSDVLRFFNNRVWVFSENDGDPFPDLADVGLPPTLQGNVAGPFPENGPEGNNGIAYFPPPGSGQPGDETPFGGPPVNYQFTSDAAVPEPATAAWGALGIAVACFARRRNRAAQA